MSTRPEQVQQVPGIIYSPLEGRARIHGTGIDVWLVAMTYETANGDWDVVRQAFDWLSERQLRAAMEFYRANPEMIRERIDAEKNLDLEALWRDYPQTAPKRRSYFDEDLSDQAPATATTAGASAARPSDLPVDPAG